MRVAILTTDSREHFQEYGNPTPYFGTAPAALLQGLAAQRGVEVHVVSCLQKVISSPAKIADNIWYHGLHVPKIGWLRTGYQGCIRAVRQKLRTLRPDIVHGQGTERDCAISAVLSGFPSVLTIHGNMRRIARVMGARPMSYNWLMAQLEGLVLPRAQGVVCITRHARAEVASLAKRTWVVPNAVDGGFFGIRGFPSVPPRILCVANIMKLKNQNRLIHSLEPIAPELPFTLVFLGKANQSDPFAREFLDLVGRRSWCQYGGFADRESLKAALGASTMLVLPSLEENCPMVILEAMAAGVPVVAANVGGVPDLVEDGVSGLLCDPCDPLSIQAGVRRFLSQPDFGRKVADEAQRRAQAMFRPDVIAQRHLEIYREVLSAVS